MSEKKKEKKREKIRFSDLLIPTVSAVIFLLVLFFVLFPSISNSNEMLLEIEKTRKEQKVLENNLTLVETIDFAVLQEDLSNARKVLPRRLEVAQFAYYIDSLASSKGLEFRELKAGDVSIITEDSAILDVKGIIVPMGYSGDYGPISDFFNELQLVSPFVISFGHKVELNKAGEENDTNWNLEINVTGYYIEEDEEILRVTNVSTPFRPYNSQEEMVQEFSDRVKRLID